MINQVLAQHARLVGWMAVLAVLSIACSGNDASHREAAPVDIMMDRPDGSSVRATLYPVETPHPPGLVLTPMAGRGRAAWSGFARRAQRKGIVTLAHDIDEPEDGSFDSHSIERALADVDAARALLVDRGAAPNAIAVMGAGLGANLALRYAIDHAGVAALVLVSPGAEYHGVAIDPSDGEPWQWPLLLIISTGDAYAASTGREMNRTAPGFVELREYEGSAFGIDLLDRSDQANEQVLLWLSQIIGP